MGRTVQVEGQDGTRENNVSWNEDREEKDEKTIGHVNGALLPKTEREVESLVSLPQPSASVGRR